MLEGAWGCTEAGACAGKVHVRNTIEQLKLVGPRSLGVALLTAGFVGMVFTIQVPHRCPCAPLLPCAHATRLRRPMHADC